MLDDIAKNFLDDIIKGIMKNETNEKKHTKLDDVEISIIIPVYNEEKNLERFSKEVFPILDNLNRKYEVIAVDDGSKDDSWKVMKNLAKKHSFFTALRHSRNYGMGAAYQTAVDYSSGKYIITYSADIEVPPKYIKDVLKKLDDGYDVVNTWRKGRWQEEGGLKSTLRRYPSKVANYLIKKISGVDIKDTGSGLKGFRRFVMENLKIYGDMHRFLPAYASLYTKKIVEIPVEYKERMYGKSAYGSIKRTFTVFLDLFSMKFMLSFSTKPFSMMPGRIFGTVGLIAFGLGTLITFYLAFVKIFMHENIGDRPLFMVGLIFIVLGIQLIMTGLLGELLLRIYFESSNRKPYIVTESENANLTDSEV